MTKLRIVTVRACGIFIGDVPIHTSSFFGKGVQPGRADLEN